MKPEYITIHCTGNDASAENEIAYMIRNNNEVSYHFAVDDKGAVQGLPLDRNGWHCSDGGNGTGNRKSIGIEICYSKSGGERFNKAYQNAIELTAQLMKQHNIPASKIMYHQSWCGKYCPHRLLDMRIDLKAFRAVAQQKCNDMYERKVIDVKVDGVNVTRNTDFLVLYAGKASTGTNQWGTEVAVDKKGVASAPVYGKGNMAIPSGGYVLSGHGKNSEWLLKNIKKGQKVNLSVE
jgi:hypothetical protein